MRQPMRADIDDITNNLFNTGGFIIELIFLNLVYVPTIINFLNKL